MPRRIRAVSGKGRIRRNADIFVGRDWGSFRFGAGVGQEPAGKSAGEAAWNISASRSRRRNGSAQVTGCALSRFLDFGLRLVKFRLGNWRRRRSCGLSTIFGERLAREKNGFFRDRAGSGGTGCFGRAMIKAALRGTTGFKTTGLPAAIFRASLITATIIVTAGLVSSRFALRRSVFGRREVASAYVRALRASATMASTTAAPASATATVTAAITTPVSTAIGTTAITLAGAIAATAGAWRVILRGIVVGREILRCGGVRIRLALFRVVVRIVVDFGGVSVGDFAFRSVLLAAAGLLAVRERFMAQRFVMRIFVMQCFVRFVRGFFAVSVVGVLFFMYM
jgi:hypothetical protein